MDSADLAFFTTQELIQELMRRQTFLGVVIQSEEEYRQEHWGPERTFKVHFNSNLDTQGAARLLDVVSESLEGEYFLDRDEA
jgi:hypothetical protein